MTCLLSANLVSKNDEVVYLSHGDYSSGSKVNFSELIFRVRHGAPLRSREDASRRTTVGTPRKAGPDSPVSLFKYACKGAETSISINQKRFDIREGIISVIYFPVEISLLRVWAT